MKLSRLERKMIEEYWMHIDDYRKKLEFRYWELTEKKSVDENVGGGKSSDISDTTARKAMLLAEDELYQNLKRIVDGIDRLYETLDDDEKIIVDMRYRTKRGHNEWEDIAYELGYSRRKVLKIRDGIIDRTANEVKWA